MEQAVPFVNGVHPSNVDLAYSIGASFQSPRSSAPSGHYHHTHHMSKCEYEWNVLAAKATYPHHNVIVMPMVYNAPLVDRADSDYRGDESWSAPYVAEAVLPG